MLKCKHSTLHRDQQHTRLHTAHRLVFNVYKKTGSEMPTTGPN